MSRAIELAVDAANERSAVAPSKRTGTRWLFAVLAAALMVLPIAWLVGTAKYRNCLVESDPVYPALAGPEKLGRYAPSRTLESHACAKKSSLPEALIF